MILALDARRKRRPIPDVLLKPLSPGALSAFEKGETADNDPKMLGALETARAQNEYFARTGNFVGPLHGIPIAVKDNYDTIDMRTTATALAGRPFDEALFFEITSACEPGTKHRRPPKGSGPLAGEPQLEEISIINVTTACGPTPTTWAPQEVSQLSWEHRL